MLLVKSNTSWLVHEYDVLIVNMIRVTKVQTKNTDPIQYNHLFVIAADRPFRYLYDGTVNINRVIILRISIIMEYTVQQGASWPS